MELHSYAKRRTTLKKWSIEQKRILVKTRIAYESLFAQKPRGSVVPWKKVMSIAKLDDYNVFFVRKQWSNMVAKYKQYKINRLGHIPTQAIDDEMIVKITEEWEFFAPIHEYMMLKSRNLHSYALQYHGEPILEANSNSNSTQSSTECVNIYSSDTNDIPLPNENISDLVATAQNTDHDFYSKKWVEQHKKQQNLFIQPMETTQEPFIVMDIKTENIFESQSQAQLPAENEVIITSTQTQQSQLYQPIDVPMDVQPPQEPLIAQIQNHEQEFLAKKPNIKTNNHLSERDRYYRHKRRFNRRFERRFDAILQVVGQVVKAEYPSIDISPLMQAANAAVELGSQISGHIFSSGEDIDDESDEDKAQKMTHQKNANGQPRTSIHDTS